MTGKTTHKIYQIFYNSKTKEENDKGFLQLDNSSNLRPDWSEYWPIRNYLLSNDLSSRSYYGFFSPKFKQKTNLTSDDVHKYLDSAKQDIVIFSPFFDQSAMSLNVFEQAESSHSNVYPTLIDTFQALGAQIDIKRMVMTSRETVFCNFFAAKKHVWEVWFDYCEKLFEICESSTSPLATPLNVAIGHSGGVNPLKVFVMERMISYLIVTNIDWSVKTYNPVRLPYTDPFIAMFEKELLELDALKISFCATGLPKYIDEYADKRFEFVTRINNILDGLKSTQRQL